MTRDEVTEDAADWRVMATMACAGVPEMLRTLADDRRPGPVADMARRQADRVEVLLDKAAPNPSRSRT